VPIPLPRQGIFAERQGDVIRAGQRRHEGGHSRSGCPGRQIARCPPRLRPHGGIVGPTAASCRRPGDPDPLTGPFRVWRPLIRHLHALGVPTAINYLAPLITLSAPAPALIGCSSPRPGPGHSARRTGATALIAHGQDGPGRDHHRRHHRPASCCPRASPRARPSGSGGPTSSATSGRHRDRVRGH
jgi:hypothetical protein